MTWFRRCLPVACAAAASLPSSARLSRAPGPGSEEPAAAPAPRWRWQHPRGPVRSRQPPPPPPPPARGNTGHRPAEWGWGPRGARLGLPLFGCESPLPGPGAPLRRATLPPACASSLPCSPAHPLAGSLAAPTTSGRLQLSRPLYPSLALGAVTSPL